MDTFVLSKKIIEATWPDDLIADIKKWGTPAQNIWVKLSKR